MPRWIIYSSALRLDGYRSITPCFSQEKEERGAEEEGKVTPRLEVRRGRGGGRVKREEMVWRRRRGEEASSGKWLSKEIRRRRRRLRDQRSKHSGHHVASQNTFATMMPSGDLMKTLKESNFTLTRDSSETKILHHRSAGGSKKADCAGGTSFCHRHTFKEGDASLNQTSAGSPVVKPREVTCQSGCSFTLTPSTLSFLFWTSKEQKSTNSDFPMRSQTSWGRSAFHNGWRCDNSGHVVAASDETEERKRRRRRKMCESDEEEGGHVERERERGGAEGGLKTETLHNVCTFLSVCCRPAAPPAGHSVTLQLWIFNQPH